VDPKDFRYLRPGHVNLERSCDELATHLTKLLPGTGVLPAYWRWTSQEVFVEEYKELGSVVWAKSASYHMLLINGRHVFRLWTDSSKTIIVDLCTELADQLADTFEVQEVPESTYRKTKPMTKRIRIKTKRHVEILVLQTLICFGLV
jgi:hypothetical protein